MNPDKNSPEQVTHTTESVPVNYSNTAEPIKFNDGQNSRKIKIIALIVAGTALLIGLTLWGVFFALSSMDKRDSEKSAQAELSAKAAAETAALQLKNQKEAIKKSEAAKVAAEKRANPNYYPPELRKIYVGACNFEDESNCQCEVDYFEKNLPVEQFSDAMKKDKESAKYNDVFFEAFEACENA